MDGATGSGNELECYIGDACLSMKGEETMRGIVLRPTGTMRKGVVKLVHEFGPIEFCPQQPTQAHFWVAGESAFV
jgi:hypothetical protein